MRRREASKAVRRALIDLAHERLLHRVRTGYAARGQRRAHRTETINTLRAAGLCRDLPGTEGFAIELVLPAGEGRTDALD